MVGWGAETVGLSPQSTNSLPPSGPQPKPPSPVPQLDPPGCAAKGPHLEPGMGIKLIEKVHEQVNLEGADTQHHVLLRLRPVPTVVTP